MRNGKGKKTGRKEVRGRVGTRWDGEGKCGGNEVKLETRGRVLSGLVGKIARK